MKLSPRSRDLTGKEFGCLKALRPVKRNKNRYIEWEFECVCGKRIIISGSAVWLGKRKSCGCRKNRRIRRGFPFERATVGK